MRHLNLRVNRRRNSNLLTRRQQKKSNFDFVKKNHGSIGSEKIGKDIIKCNFSSSLTGRTAFAFGPTFDIAYQNMIDKFNIKYSLS